VEKAREVDQRFPRGAREHAASFLHPPSGPAAARLRRLVDEGGYFVTTGQQPGLFTGPLYSLYKAFTAIRLAGVLEPLLGRSVLALFWIASEDHDWAEADHAHVLDVKNQIHTLRVTPPAGAGQLPLHRIRLDSGIRDTVNGLLELLPESDFSPLVRDCLREAYAPGRTLPEGFHTVLAWVLRDLPILFVDAANPELKAASLPTLFREMEGAQEHEKLLARTAAGLEMAGYHVQVPILEGGVNLFLEGEKGRDRMYRDGNRFRLHRSGSLLSPDELRSRAGDDPSLLSPNVLLRPVVESTLFPTLAYVGGPGEVSYFAQLKELFQAHGIRMPIVRPRHSATLVERKVRKVLDKFGIAPDSLDRPHHELASEIARAELPEEIRRTLAEMRETLGKGAGSLARAAQEIDPTLKGPVTHARNAAFAALDEAERKILQAVKRENEVALDQIDKAQRHLFPLGRPQERVLNIFYYLIRYGPELVPAILDEFAVALGDDSA
jgi:bacillithiol synthase